MKNTKQEHRLKLLNLPEISLWEKIWTFFGLGLRRIQWSKTIFFLLLLLFLELGLEEGLKEEFRKSKKRRP